MCPLERNRGGAGAIFLNLLGGGADWVGTPEEELKNDAGLRPQCRLPLLCPVVAHLGELAALSASLHQERWLPFFSLAFI